ncbi:serine/threonine-protein phosphatase 2A regulatory subunit B'' subunit alpha-like protein [Corchorus olitorius]|uniref:Serine/threonine-protein phosphatase 2A regulatory subunit B'' subunit alpha-like protein n=1 Tax=Corchorus olitorius TaxID=93759 RepID=A0A1R3HG19_9ROSI|nr:serine/threonine-protein phosphatase 2A regulatory subunit B'' subunit alpha-like protein [Corchorus olitorius]
MAAMQHADEEEDINKVLRSVVMVFSSLNFTN